MARGGDVLPSAQELSGSSYLADAAPPASPFTGTGFSMTGELASTALSSTRFALACGESSRGSRGGVRGAEEWGLQQRGLLHRACTLHHFGSEGHSVPAKRAKE